MRIELTQDVWETDRNGNRTGLKVTVRRGQAVPFVAGAVIECSDATGAKFIERGLAVACKPDSEESAD
jgi:hypothetical protein